MTSLWATLLPSGIRSIYFEAGVKVQLPQGFSTAILNTILVSSAGGILQGSLSLLEAGRNACQEAPDLFASFNGEHGTSASWVGIEGRCPCNMTGRVSWAQACCCVM